MNDRVGGLLRFIKASPSAFHATETLAGMLERSGAKRLQETEIWRLTPGESYFVTRNGSSLIAFTLPERGFAPFQICASHCDSPTFRIKENAEIAVRDKYVQLNVEFYGGVVLSSWLDRPLSVAGRAVVRDGNGVRAQLVNIDRELALIPNVAIHMNRAINDGYKYNPAVDMLPLYAITNATGGFKKLISEACGVGEGDLLGSDLFLYNRTPGCVWGANGEFVSSPQLDDLECAYASITAFLAARAGEHVNMCCVFDNEEVGSRTKQGADSTFLSDVCERVALALGASRQELIAAIASGFMLSADNAHAVHPNHPEYADPGNQAFMNEGVVIKSSASQKYAADGVATAIFHEILARADVPFQHYANRSDLPGGSTLGNISGAHVSLNTLDIGAAQLAMHSCYETAGAEDVCYLIDGIRAFYESEVRCAQDGRWTIA